MKKEAADYAKNKVTERYFYNYHGFCHGLRNGLLQYRNRLRWYEQPDFLTRISRDANYVADCSYFRIFRS